MMSTTATYQPGDTSKGLRGLADRLDTTMIAEALEEALEPTRAQAQANLEAVSAGKYSTGATAREGVHLEVTPTDDGMAVDAEVGMFGRGKRSKASRAYIAYWLEYGTARQYARPWMRPAWDSTKKGVAALFAWALRKRLGAA